MDRSSSLWVPIIRSWALTRGFALHPGTRNRYEIRYTRTGSARIAAGQRPRPSFRHPQARSSQKPNTTSPKKRKRIWSAGRDLNPRLYGFAGRSLGPLGHRRREPQRTGGKLRGGPGASGPAAVDAACAGRPRAPSETPRSEASGAGGHGCCHRGRARVAQAGHHRCHRRASQDHVVDHHDVASSRRLASPVAG